MQQQIEEIEEELVELTDNDTVDETSVSKYVIKETEGECHTRNRFQWNKPKKGKSNLKSTYLPNENKKTEKVKRV